MRTTELTEQSFEPTVAQEGIVLVDFWAAWCAPCRTFAPIYERVAARHEDIVFGKLDTEAQPTIARMLRIDAIPTLMIFRDGVPLFSQPGLMPEKVLEELVRRVRALDMDEVRAAVAEAAARRAHRDRATLS